MKKLFEKIKEKIRPKTDPPKEFKNRLWTEIVLLALCLPGGITFFVFDFPQVFAVLAMTSAFLICDMARLYYCGYLDHYKVFSGPCLRVDRKKNILGRHTEIVFEDEESGTIFDCGVNKETNAVEGSLITAILPEKYNYRDMHGIRYVNTIFLKIGRNADESDEADQSDELYDTPEEIASDI